MQKYAKPGCRSKSTVRLSPILQLPVQKTRSEEVQAFPDIHFEPFEEYIVRYTTLAEKPHVKKALAE